MTTIAPSSPVAPSRPFPIDLSAFKPLVLDPAANPTLSPEQRKTLEANIQLCRDAIIFFTAVADARGLGGHTGGPFDIVPEVLIADAFMRAGTALPYYFDEAGHRVAIQYLMSVLNREMPVEKLWHYREFDSKLPGHPERNFTPGVKFSSGRLGHMWPYVNGVAMAHPGKATFMFGSDGSEQEGNDAEAARLAVAKKINIKLVIDDNDVTIAGHPSEYLPGYSVAKTLEGHGLGIVIVQGENLDELYAAMAKAATTPGPVAIISRRKMAPGVDHLEGSPHGHDVIKTAYAVEYFTKRGNIAAVEALSGIPKNKSPYKYRGSNDAQGKNRDTFGKIVCGILDKMAPAERVRTVRVFDCDLEGSCGLHHIHKNHPEVYVSAGIMERGNFSAAAGFGYDADKQGVFGTFAAFLEMVISELTMARLNDSNVLCHFSHSGCDDMADNTCHFGINNFFADSGLPEHDKTALYFPADQHQFKSCVERVFGERGPRFVFSTRSAVPDILKPDGSLFYGPGYTFTPGKDEVIREGTAGYVVSYGEMLYRALDAVERLRERGIDVGLVNKATLNKIDEATLRKVGSTGFVLVAESQNVKTGLGIRYGTWLLQRGLTPTYDHLGTHRIGNGGLWEHVPYQGLDPDSIIAKVESLAR